jgi:ssDNA-binding replication factor A large subunit
MSKTINWIGCWSDESSEVLELVRDMKAAGIRAKRDYSPYVGHHTLKIDATMIEKAKEFLRDRGEDYIADNCLAVE